MIRHNLITGGAGFIGSHLCDELLVAGEAVTVFDDLSAGQLANLRHLGDEPRLRVVQGTITDAAVVDRLVREADRVFHLAAPVGVRRVMRSSLDTVHGAIQGTQQVLEAACRSHRSGRPIAVFVASSSEVYGKNPRVPWREEDDSVFGSVHCRRWAYGMSKAVCEYVALGLYEEFGLPVVIGRFFNVVGRRQIAGNGMVIPSFIEAAERGGPLLVHGDGLQERCFTHVLDVVAAIRELMSTPSAIGKVFNIGTDRPMTIKQAAEQVVAIVNPRAELKHVPYQEVMKDAFEDVPRRIPDLTRLHSTIRARPTRDLATAIREQAGIRGPLQLRPAVRV